MNENRPIGVAMQRFFTPKRTWRTLRLPSSPRTGARSSCGCRKGAAAVEAAVTLPFFLLLLLTTIDCCCCIFLKQSLTIAAYEGARVAVVPGSTTTNVQAQAQLILDERKVKNAKISVSPSNFSALTLGEAVTVTVSAHAQANSPISMGLFSTTEPKASVTMMMEH
jgi:Flp pilus assembly protein TadG